MSLRLQSVSVYAEASKGKRTTAANCIDLFSPDYSLSSTKLRSLSECGRKDMHLASLSQPPPLQVKFSQRSGLDSFPRREVPGRAVRVHASVRIVIDWHVCESVNHTISAQMPLGEEQPAPAINYRW